MKLVYNAGGQGREVLRYLREAEPGEEIVLVDDRDHTRAIPYPDALALKSAHDCPVFIAFGDPALRRTKTAQVEADGFALFDVHARTSVVGERVELGPMSMLMDYAVLTADIRIGRGFHANLHASVSHDCIVGDFVTLGPKATVLGRVEIGDGAYIG
ncbi:MAG: acetyltransferase, partial [Pseudomonadota bacterium]